MVGIFEDSRITKTDDWLKNDNKNVGSCAVHAEMLRIRPPTAFIKVETFSLIIDTSNILAWTHVVFNVALTLTKLLLPLIKAQVT